MGGKSTQRGMSCSWHVTFLAKASAIGLVVRLKLKEPPGTVKVLYSPSPEYLLLCFL